jgi:hypothetical protein
MPQRHERKIESAASTPRNQEMKDLKQPHSYEMPENDVPKSKRMQARKKKIRLSIFGQSKGCTDCSSSTIVLSRTRD